MRARATGQSLPSLTAAGEGHCFDGSKQVSSRSMARDSLNGVDDVEHGDAATSEHEPLLGRGADDSHAVPPTWREYPAHLWNSSTRYVSSTANNLRTNGIAGNRGKQRQTSANGVAGDDDDEAAQSGRSEGHSRLGRLSGKVARFRREHPRTYAVSIAIGCTFLLGFVLFLVALLHLIFVTLRAPDEATQQRIAARALSVDGPDNVEVVSLNEKGLTVRIDGRIGMDGDVALDEWLGSRGSRGWWNQKERSFVEYIFGKVKGVQVEIGTIALRSPDWSTTRPIERVDLIPDQNKTFDEVLALNALHMSQVGSSDPLPVMDLVTFQLEPLQVPIPPLRAHVLDAGEKGPVANLPMNLTVRLTPSGPNLMAFAQHVLENKTAFIDIRSNSARIRGMGAKEWARGALQSSSRWAIPGWVDVSVGESWRRLAQKLPKLDGGNETNPDEILNLTRYDFEEIRQGGKHGARALGLHIQAEAMNPLGKLLNGRVGWSLPFGAYLPVGNINQTEFGKSTVETVLLAAVATEPIELHGQNKIPLNLNGRVVTPPQLQELSRRDQHPLHTSNTSNDTTTSPEADALSGFLSRFLRGDPNTLIVRGGSPFRPPLTAGSGGAVMSKEKTSLAAPLTDSDGFPGEGDELPPWLDRLLRTMEVPIAFPGSKVTDLIQNVSISDLKITPHPFEREKLVCGGVIMGVLNMPGQLAAVDVQITDLWPDVLIFNGKPPSMEEPAKGAQLSERSMGGRSKKGKKPKEPKEPEEPEPLPDPLPEHAFGRVVPHTWTPAETYIDPEDPAGQRKLLRSVLKDVPFTVLPGRGAEFRSFSWKIVTGEGALAGIDGKAKAKIWNSGLGKLTLSNMPVKGVFTVGKRGGGGPGDGDDDGDDGLWA